MGRGRDGARESFAEKRESKRHNKRSTTFKMKPLSSGSASWLIPAAIVVSAIAIVQYYHHLSKKKKIMAVSTLTEKRGSDGMGLPDSMSPETIDIITATAGVVAPKSVDITSDFYTNVLKKPPGLLAFFNPAHK